MSAPPLSYAGPDDPPWQRRLIRLVERITGRPILERLYANARAVDDDRAFWKGALDALDVTPVYDGDRLRALPRSGPLVVVANHPFGVLDGLVLCDVVARVRPDFRILVHRKLCRDDRFASHFLPVDFRERADARRTNCRSVRRALSTLQDGGAVALFPGAGIATAPALFGRAQDLDWTPLAARLIQHRQATVVPIYFHGQNSRLFQIVSQFSATLRLSLIIREVVRQRGATVPVRIGAPIPFSDVDNTDDPDALTQTLREHTMALGAGPHGRPADSRGRPSSDAPS